MNNFVAIDFETANYGQESACAIGLARCVEGEATATFYSLIRPPVLYFIPRFIDIHGITPADVRSSPTFAQLWGEVAEFIGNSRLVAHNATFDRRVLEACLAYYGLPAPAYTWQCSCRMARSCLGGAVENHRLDTLARFFGLHFRHHDALEDALMCAQITVFMNRMSR